MPVVAARLLAVAVHALLHHGPFAVIGDEETVQVQIKTILHRGAIDLRDQPAGARKPGTVKANTVAEQAQLVGGSSGMPAAAAADMDAEFASERRQSALQCPND